MHIKTLVIELELNKARWRPRYRWEESIELDHKKMWNGSLVGCCEHSNEPLLKKPRNFLTSE